MIVFIPLQAAESYKQYASTVAKALSGDSPTEITFIPLEVAYGDQD